MPVILEDPPDNLTIIDIGIFLTNDLAIELVTSEISLNPALPGDFELDISSGNIESISLIEFRDTTQAFSFSSDSLMLFEIVLTGDVSACTEISYSANFQIDGDSTCQTGDVLQTVCVPSTTISGLVEKIPDTKGVPGVEITADGQISSISSVESNSNGNYSIPNFIPCDIVDLETKKTEGNGCGLTSFDITLLSDHILLVDLFDEEYQYIAADANNSGTISTLDNVAIRAVILGTQSSLSKPWVVLAKPNYDSLSIPSQHLTVPNYSETYQTNTLFSGTFVQGIFGIKVGDVNAAGCDQDSIAKSSGRPVTEAQTSGTHSFRIENRVAETGQEIFVPVYADKFHDRRLLSLGLQFSPEAIEIIDLVKPSLPDFDGQAYTVNHDRPGAVDILWFPRKAESVSVRPSQPLFYIKARAKRDIANLKNLVELRSARTENWVYTGNSEFEAIQLEFFEENKTSKGEGQYLKTNLLPTEKVLASPNPFVHRLNLQFVSEHSSNATIEIHTLDGALVHSSEKQLTKGENRIVLENLGHLPTGYFYYRLFLPNQTLSGKVLKVKK